MAEQDTSPQQATESHGLEPVHSTFYAADKGQALIEDFQQKINDLAARLSRYSQDLAMQQPNLKP